MPRYLLCSLMLLLQSIAYGQRSVYINPSVTYHYQNDTATLNPIIAVLDSFFTTKNNSYSENIYWDKADFATLHYPYLSLYRQEISYKLNDPMHYRPSVLEVLPAGEKNYLIKIAYAGQEKDGFSSLRFIYNIIASRTPEGYRLKNATPYLTRNWKRYDTKTIRFYISPIRKPDLKQANRLDSFNRSVAAFLQVPVEHVTYYSSENARTLFEAKGYDYIPNMYYDSLGGQCEPYANIVHSGMNSEWYPHELVHIYTQKNFDGINKIADEGFCTFIGGSYNLPLDAHLKITKQYIITHPQARLDDLLFREQDIGPHTSSTYVLGGLICRLVYRKNGLTGLKEWLSVGNDEKKLLATLGKSLGFDATSGLHDFLYRELMKY